MLYFSDNYIFIVITVFIFAITIFISYIKWRQNYFKRLNITTMEPTFFIGNTIRIFALKESFAEFFLRTYEYLKRKNVAYGGFYTLFVPQFVPVDPELVKDILINNFEHFVDRGIYMNEEGDPLSAHLFSLTGMKWKNLRAKLTPTFTSGKMKMMFDILVKCGDDLKEEMDKTVDRQEAIEIKDILSRFTTDIIASCAFGIECNSLKNPDDDFNRNGRLFFEATSGWHVLQFIAFVFPDFVKMFNAPAVFPPSGKFFDKVVKDTVKYREKNNISRKDFMHLLLQLKNCGEMNEDNSILKPGENNEKNVSLTLQEISAQALIFFLAGFETSSTTMTFCLYELSRNQEIQDRLREEVKQVLRKHGGDLTYEAIMEMQYLEKVINETLRKYPPLSLITRVCTKDYKVPGSDIILKKGAKVQIPVIGIHRDGAYYPNPEKFEPERFSEENKRNRPPCTFIPFGDGPRICIGLRFGMMQTKVGLAVLLKNYRFGASSKTKEPVKFEPKSFVTTPKGGLWLNYEKI